MAANNSIPSGIARRAPWQSWGVVMSGGGDGTSLDKKLEEITDNKDLIGFLWTALYWELVPGVGLEPTRALAHRILSPVRLPVPPPGHVNPHDSTVDHCKRGTEPEFLTTSLSA